MTRGSLRVVAGIVSAALVVGSLSYLQILYAERDPVSCFIAYSALAVATLIGITFLHRTSKPNMCCLSSAALLFGYVSARALTSPDPYAARADLYLSFAELVTYALAAIVFARPAPRIAILGALLAFAVTHVVISLVQAGLAQNYSLIIPSLAEVERSERGMGLYLNPDHLAGLLELVGAAGLSMACWSRWPRWTRVIFAYLTGICYLGLLLTGSRGGYLSASASLLCFFILSFFALASSGWPVIARVGGVGAVVLVVAATGGWLLIRQSPQLMDRAANVVTVDRGRVALWAAAIDQWKSQPVFGTGSGTYTFFGRQCRREEMQAEPGNVHNDYLHLLAEYGVVGTGAFLCFLAAHLRAGWRTFVTFGPRRTRTGAMRTSDRFAITLAAFSAIAAYAIHSLFDFNMHVPANALVLTFIFGTLANSGGETAPSQRPREMLLPRVVAAAASLVLLVQSWRLLPGERWTEEARLSLRDEHPLWAIWYAKKALTCDERNPRTYFYLGRAHEAVGLTTNEESERTTSYEAAIDAFDKARRLSPLDGSYPLDIAFLYDQLGRFPEAEWMYDLALERDPRSETVLNLYQMHLDAWKSGNLTITR